MQQTQPPKQAQIYIENLDQVRFRLITREFQKIIFTENSKMLVKFKA